MTRQLIRAALLALADRPPVDLSLDVYFFYVARRQGFEVRTFDVRFGAREHLAPRHLERHHHVGLSVELFLDGLVDGQLLLDQALGYHDRGRRLAHVAQIQRQPQALGQQQGLLEGAIRVVAEVDTHHDALGALAHLAR